MEKYLSLLKHFEDNQTAILSIHNLCLTGTLTAGDWIGPNAICFALKYIFEAHKEELENLSIHVCRDGNIFFNDIESKLENDQKLLILIPTQLGIGKTLDSPIYAAQLHHLFKFSQNNGILCGNSRDNAVYAFGHYKDNFLVLDPHQINEVHPVSFDTLDHFHANGCQNLSTSPCTNLSSAVACSFYIQNLDDFARWKSYLQQMQWDFGKENYIFSLFIDNRVKNKDNYSFHSESSSGSSNNNNSFAIPKKTREDTIIQTSPHLQTDNENILYGNEPLSASKAKHTLP